MNEREWRERFESTQYDDDDPDDTRPAPAVSELEELEEEQGEGRVPRRRRWVPVVYYVRRAAPPSSTGRE